MKLPLGLLAMIAAIAVEGCGHDCTEMGCVQSVTMNLAVPLEQDGEYHFEVNTDGQLLTCTAFVPMKRDGTDPACSDGFNVERQQVTTATADAVTSTPGDSIVALRISGEHGQILVSATRDGVRVLSASFTPRYEGVAINGEGCGECPMAKHTIGG